MSDPPTKLVTVSDDSVSVVGVDENWTLAELVQRVAQALAAADVRAPNGRVTEVPDARMIRWYATIGLVDRPHSFRGRTALYGPRHLWQLVAVKRRQAQGHPLAQIQAELAGATDQALRQVALLEPLEPLSDPVPEADAVPVQRPQGRAAERFWSRPPAPAPAPVTLAPLLRAPPDWAEKTVHGVSLGGGATLLVGSPAVADHVAAIRAAAQPLLAVLSALGLLHPDEGVPA
jgi:DNA-binding transcriptional MerR regulator